MPALWACWARCASVLRRHAWGRQCTAASSPPCQPQRPWRALALQWAGGVELQVPLPWARTAVGAAAAAGVGAAAQRGAAALLGPRLQWQWVG